MTKLVHYAYTPGRIVPYSTKSELKAAMKPSGLWYSPDTEDGWRDWCRQEDFGLGHYDHDVWVDYSRLYIIRSGSEILEFAEAYGTTPEWTHRSDYIAADPYGTRRSTYQGYHIDWPKVAEDGWSGIEISPYLWSFRHNIPWYYGWDVASGCVWDPKAIGIEPAFDVKECA